MGLTAEFLASSRGISRKSQEEYALESHRRATQAADTGFFKNEIVQCQGLDGNGVLAFVDRDQSIRSDASLAAMEKLNPVFIPKLGNINELHQF